MVGNEPGEMDDYQAYPAYRRGRGRWIREWLLPLLCFAAILTLSLVAARQWYFITDHELRLCIQIGMTMDEATEAFGGAPGSVWRAPFDGQRDGWPRSFKDFEDGTIALYTRIWPSAYLWVHFDRQGRVDRTFLVTS